eukprot:COSAG02_NODE_3939_length_6012_cov_129.782006_2_plen_76_part_00
MKLPEVCGRDPVVAVARSARHLEGGDSDRRWGQRWLRGEWRRRVGRKGGRAPGGAHVEDWLLLRREATEVEGTGC